jgi:hypothetical protein
MVSGHDVDLVDEERMDEFIVKFKGPQDSLYTGVSNDRHVLQSICCRVFGRSVCNYLISILLSHPQ